MDVVAANGSTRVPRLAEDVLLLFPVVAITACQLRGLFDCEDCDADDCDESAHDELMLEIEWGHSLMSVCPCCGSRWRVRMMDNFRRITLPSGITLVTFVGERGE